MKLTNQTPTPLQANQQVFFTKAKISTLDGEGVSAQAPESAPRESFTPSTLAAPTVTLSEALEKTQDSQAEAEPLKTPRDGTDMARMLEDIEQADEADGEMLTGFGGTLAVLSSPLSQIHSDLARDGQRHEHGHVSEHKKNAHLGGHLATEVVEKIGHGAHHGAGEISGHAAGKVASGVGPGLGEVKGEIAGAVAEAKGHAVGVKMELTGSLLDVKSNAVENASGAAGHAGEVAHHISTGLATALAGAAAVSGGIGGIMLYHGGKELAHGVKEKSAELVAEGVGGLAVGARSVAAAAVMANMTGVGSSTLGAVAGVAAQTLTPLGVLHGAIDVGLGVKDIVKGEDRVGGMLKVGFGGAVIAGALVGGIPLTLTALGVLGAKVTHSVIKANKARKQVVAKQPAPVQASAGSEETSGAKDIQT